MGSIGLNRFKLEKLKIFSFRDRRRSVLAATIEVMVNPPSFAVKYENALQKLQGMNSSGRSANYSQSRPREITLDLTIGEEDSCNPLFPGLAKDLSTRVKEFRQSCLEMDGETHEPRFLVIQWGKGELAGFACRLKSADINYTSFDRNGAPLRATVTTVFVEDIEETKRLKIEGKRSPDLTRTRTVKSGDTLPLLCKEVYGSSRYYLRVAEANQLNDFRVLTPGQDLIFPALGA